MEKFRIIFSRKEGSTSIIKHELSNLDCDVHGFATEEDILTKTGKLSPNLILLLYQHPQIDAVRLCRELKKLPNMEDVPVLIMNKENDAKITNEITMAGGLEIKFQNEHFNSVVKIIKYFITTKIQESDLKMSEKLLLEKMQTGHDELFNWMHWYDFCNKFQVIRELKRSLSVKLLNFLDMKYSNRDEYFFHQDSKAHKTISSFNTIKNDAMKHLRELLDKEARRIRLFLHPDTETLLLNDVSYSHFAMGPIQPLLNDIRITDILVSRFNDIYIELRGRLVKTSVRFDTEEHLMLIISRILRFSGKELNESKPFVETRLRDGSRISATLPPLSIHGATLTIRKFVVPQLDFEDLVRYETMNMEIAVCLDLFVKAGMNMIVSGSTGAGKTTLLNLLASCVPLNERIITVEDTAELKIKHREVIPDLIGRLDKEELIPAENMESFETRFTKSEQMSLGVRDIIRLALRKRPDRIIIGEVRGPEALDMLNAMNTGHRGCLSTIHANNTEDLMVRLENMLIEANPNLPLESIGRMIVAGLNLAIQIVKFHDNIRRITEVTEIYGYDRDKKKILLRPLYIFDPQCSEQFVTVNAPSERMQLLMVEYLMKTGRYHSNWNQVSSDDEIKRIFRALFKKNYNIYFEHFQMKGLTDIDKEKLYMECFHYMITEIYGSNRNLNTQVYSREGHWNQVEIPYYELVDNRIIRRIYQISRLALATRLKLTGKAYEFVVKGNIADHANWLNVFPVDAENEGVSGHMGEGFSREDIIESFEKAIQENFEGIKNEIILNKLDSVKGFLRSERVSMLLPYLRLGVDHQQQGRGQVTFKDVVETKDL